MGRMQRTKGQSGEREFASLIFDHLGVEMRRNLSQTQNGGHDLVTGDHSPAGRALSLFAIEIKRHRSASPGAIAQWWIQTTEQAVEAELIPCLAFRADRLKWRVVVPLYAVSDTQSESNSIEMAAELSVEGFGSIIREIAAFTPPHVPPDNERDYHRAGVI